MVVSAVECSNFETLKSLVNRYITTKTCDILYTDSERLKEYSDGEYGSNKCIYNSNIVALWLMVTNNALLVITNINNSTSELFTDVKCNYTVVSVDDVYPESGD